jgi:hypothetical protein
MRVHSADGSADYHAGEPYYWSPGHNLEAVTEAEYLEISDVADYEMLMEHCAAAMAD